jgi:hypothetical protein
VPLIDISLSLVYLQIKSQEEITVKRVFETLSGVLLLLLIVATTIDVVNLLLFALGLFATLTVTLFIYHKESLPEWIVVGSILVTIFLLFFWVTTILSSGKIFPEIFLPVIGGSSFLGIVAIVYLRSKG